MPKLVAHGATLKCSEGTAPGSLSVEPHGVGEDSTPLATVEHHLPMAHVPTFGQCRSLQNPQVQSATAAAQGVLTPMPCVPVTPQAWSPGATEVTMAGKTALSDDSTCDCQWGGSITIADPAAVVTKP